jgi:hypothetical protein
LKSRKTHSDIRIWIRNIQVLHQYDDLLLSSYEEWQEIDGMVTTRLSSVLFKQVGIHPNGLLWLHVHETWVNTCERSI